MHTCALDINGRVICWGSNAYAQLGSPSNVTGTPTQVDGMLLAVEVAASGLLTCARSTGDRIYCWGYNAFGQAGDVAAGQTINSPREVSGVRAPVGLAVSGRRACALTDSEGVWCWGELGVSSPQSPAPVNVSAPKRMEILDGAVAIGLASYHACVLFPDGLGCIGAGTFGELGHGALETTSGFVRPALPCNAR